MVPLWAAVVGCGPSTCDELAAHGITQQTCPDSELRLSVSAAVQNAVRGGALPPPIPPDLPTPPPYDGTVLVIELALNWLEGDRAEPSRRSAPYTGDAELTVELVDRARGQTPVPHAAWAGAGPRGLALALPELPDGEYTLVVTADAGFDKASAQIPLAFFTPALVHVMSDRPLYRPGEDLLLRSLVLASDGHEPLGGRPGRWKVTAPDGAELLTESDTADAWGVADTSLPLRGDAAPGRYVAAYTSGAESDQVAFEVRPFELPRTTAEVTPDRAWFRVGDELAVRGVARYASGAPVAGAAVTVTLADPGPWPVPIEWTTPREVTTAPDGTFRARFGAVPKDLVGRAELPITAVITEAGAEAVAASTTAVLSRESLVVHAITELADGLVGGVNNRAYLRITTPDGAPVREAAVQVRNPFAPTQRVREAATDVDGVAIVQLDPGDPVTIVLPVQPVRQAPPSAAEQEADAPSVRSLRELGDERPATVEESRAAERVARGLEACRGLEGADVERTLGLGVSAGGAVVRVVSGADDATTRCVAQRVRQAAFPPGDERTFELVVSLPDSARPSLDWTSRSVVDGAADVVLAAARAAGLEGRSCLQPGQGVDAATLLTVHWTVTAGSDRVDARVAASRDHGLPGGVVDCVRRPLTALKLPTKATSDAMGVLEATLDVPAAPGAPAQRTEPVALTTTGFQLQVSAAGGDATLTLPVGQVPAMRVRATPSLLRPGEQVVVELLRGPDNQRPLPEELTLRQGATDVATAKVDGNTATFVIPEGTRGFLTVEHEGVRQQLFVERADRLELALESDRAVYRPGDTAVLTVRATAGGAPVAAGVGLSGVDETLGALAPLPGPDEYGRVTIRAHTPDPPFGQFDARSLLLGRIRGKNAAQVAVQRVVVPPAAAVTAPRVGGQGASNLREDELLDAAFSRAYERAATRVAAWEEGAAADARFTNEQMVTLWGEVLAELRASGAPAVDAWGRELALHRLPDRLLAQLDPRQLVQDGTHLPEDMLAWSHHVTQSAR